MCEVLKSSKTGINHQHPGNIFAADGRVRGTTGQEIFHDPATGKTTASGSGSDLARSMLQAMAIERLANHSELSLSDDLRRQIIRQVGQLNDRRDAISGLFGLTTGAGRLKTSVAQIAEIIAERLTAEVTIVPKNIQHDPVIGLLDRGQFTQARKLFAQLALQQQLDSIAALVREPDYLGVDNSAEALMKLQTNVQANSNEAQPDRLPFALSAQVWKLFSNLYDSKVAAPKEATDQIRLQAMVNRRGITDTAEAAQLGKLLVQLLPRRASASDSILDTSHTATPAPVWLHQFEPKRIANMINSYKELKAFVDQRCFTQVFGNEITDPQLRNELVSHVTRITLDALQGDITANDWQSVALQNLLDEHAEFVGKFDKSEQTDVLS